MRKNAALAQVTSAESSGSSDKASRHTSTGAPFNVKPEEKYKAAVATFIRARAALARGLVEEIRVKRGLAYSAYARNLLNLPYSQLYGYMQTKMRKKIEAIARYKEEILKFSKKGVSKAELLSGQNFNGSLPLRSRGHVKHWRRTGQVIYEHGELGVFF